MEMLHFQSYCSTLNWKNGTPVFKENFSFSENLFQSFKNVEKSPVVVT